MVDAGPWITVYSAGLEVGRIEPRGKRFLFWFFPVCGKTPPASGYAQTLDAAKAECVAAVGAADARVDRGFVAGADAQAAAEGQLTPIATSILGQGRRPRRAAGNGNKKNAKHPNCAGGEVRCVRYGQYRAGGEDRRVR
jgi:hypothetical protein